MPAFDRHDGLGGMPLLVLFADLVLVSLISLAAISAVVIALRNRIESFQLFYGPVLFRTRLGNADVCLGCLPFGGNVATERVPFFGWGFVPSALAALAGPASLVAIGVMVFGPAPAVGRLGSAALDYVAGAWSPLAAGREKFAAALDFVAQAPPRESFGAVALFFAAINLLPVPGMAAGTVLLQGLSRLLSIPREWIERIMVMGAVLCLAALGSWIVAAIAAGWTAGR